MAEPGAAAQPAQAAARGIASVKLSPFWAASPANWFLQAEAQFAVRDVMNPLDRYYLVMAALGEPQIDLVSSVLPPAPDKTSYELIKNALVASHSLTPYQKVDRLMSMEPLGGRKPSEMLATMQKLRPPKDEHFFTFAFLQRLPREMRMLLAQDDQSDIQNLAQKADAYMALHQPQHHDVAAVAPATGDTPPADEEAIVAAANKAAAKQRGGKKNQKNFRRHRSPSPFDVHQSPLCYYHVRYGEKAHKCVDPCAWPGN
jgi:hypothetical protein